MNKIIFKIFLCIPLFLVPHPAFAQGSLGVIRILCDENDAGAEVYVDDKFKGECPLDIQIPEGLHKLTVFKTVGNSKQMEKRFEEEFKIAAGTAKRIEIKLGDLQLNKAGLEQLKIDKEIEKLQIKNLLTESQNGNPKAQFKLARFYAKGGLTTPQDLKSAFYWDFKAAGFGKNSVAYAGIYSADIDKEYAKTSGYGKTQGALIQRVFPDGPAAISGIKVSDIVTGIDSKDVLNNENFLTLIKSYKPHSSVNFRIWRKGQENILPVKFGERDEPPNQLLSGGHIISTFLIFSYPKKVHEELNKENLISKIDKLIEEIDNSLDSRKVNYIDIDKNFTSALDGNKIFGIPKITNIKEPNLILNSTTFLTGLINLNYQQIIPQFLSTDYIQRKELDRINWFWGDPNKTIYDQNNWGAAWQEKFSSNNNKNKELVNEIRSTRIMCGNKRIEKEKDVLFDCLRLEGYDNAWSFQLSTLQCKLENKCYFINSNAIIYSIRDLAIELASY